jgi:radical SAM protein with 4Fe4S-binding SPASM domain
MLIPSVPVFYNLELTPACNNACPGCGNVFDHQETRLNLSQWERILGNVSASASRFRLTGGEPTLHPDFERIVHAIVQRGIPFALFTNARWRDPQGLLEFLRCTQYCDSMLISLHGAEAETHDAFTNSEGSFTETCSNIEATSKVGSLSVNISTVITALNYDKTRDIAQFALSLGTRSVVFNRYIGPECGPIQASRQQLRAAVRAVQEMIERGWPVKFGACIPQCFCPSHSAGCLAGITYCTVDPWGSVRPCNHAPLICGSLLEQSIEEIWYSPGMQHWRNLTPAQCMGCVELPTCHGGCKAIALDLGTEKDPLIEEPILDSPATAPEQIVLSETACPESRFTVRREAFGYLLIHGSQVVPVAERAGPVLEALNGQTTLQQIQCLHGEEALSLIGTLYKRGFVQLR